MLEGGKERFFNSSYWTIPVRGSCVHICNFMFCTVISSTNITRKSRNFLESIEKFSRSLEKIEKLFRNYREIGNYREMMEKLIRNFQEMGNN